MTNAGKTKVGPVLVLILAAGMLVISRASMSLPAGKEERYSHTAELSNDIAEFPTFSDLHSDTRQVMSLNGSWQFRLDPKDAGKEERWYRADLNFDKRITVPGTWQAQGYGDSKSGEPRSNIGAEVPLQTQYLGTAWYKRKIVIPLQNAERAERKVWLKLGAVNPAAEVWLNGEFIGKTNQPGVPVRFDVTSKTQWNSENDITIRVYEENRGLGNWYNIMAQWSGLWRKVELEITPSTWIDDLRITPDIDASKAVILATVSSDEPQANDLKITAAVSPVLGKRPYAQASSTVAKLEKKTQVRIEVPLKQVKLWSPTNPHLYSAKVVLEKNGRQVDSVSDRFGMRKISAVGTQIYLNNKPVFLRGFGDDGMYPNTLSPEIDFETIRRNLKKAKDLGFNYAYPCLIMQPEEYLDAADEVGMLVKYDIPATLAFQRKGPGALPQGISFEEEQRLVQTQWLAAMKFTQNHPSLVIYSPGSEIPPKNPHLVDLYKLSKAKDPSRLVMSWSDTKHTDISNVGTLHDPMDPSERLHLIIGSETAWRDARQIPGIIHEYIGAESLPDPANIKQYRNGYVPRPELEIEKAAKARGIEKHLPALVANSEEMSNAFRKLETEEARKVKGVAGYHIWLIQDIPGYPQGVFDAFWRAKGKQPQEFIKSNGESVLLMNEVSSTNKRTFWADEQAEFEVFVSHFGETPFRNAVLEWKVVSEPQGTVLSSGRESGINFSSFTTAKLRNLKIRMPKVRAATSARLSMTLQAGQQRIQNDWSIWLFPAHSSSTGESKVRLYGSDSTRANISQAFSAAANWTGQDAGVVVSDKLDGKIRDYLNGGGRVVLLLGGNEKLLSDKSLVKTQFMPRWPLTQGEVISATMIMAHPSMSGFPHRGFCDYQFYDLIVRPQERNVDPARQGGIYQSSKREQFHIGLGEAFNLDKFSRRVEPIIRVFGRDENRAYLFEVKVGKGRLLVSTLRFKETVGRVAAATSLFDQLLKYAASNNFDPQTEITETELRSLE